MCDVFCHKQSELEFCYFLLVLAPYLDGLTQIQFNLPQALAPVNTVASAVASKCVRINVNLGMASFTLPIASSTEEQRKDEGLKFADYPRLLVATHSLALSGENCFPLGSYPRCAMYENLMTTMHESTGQGVRGDRRREPRPVMFSCGFLLGCSSANCHHLRPSTAPC